MKKFGRIRFSRVFGWPLTMVLPAVGLAASCRGPDSSDLPTCQDSHKFGTAVVPLSAVSFALPMGTMAPVGGSPLPKAHTGYMLNSADVTVTAPGNLILKIVRQVNYLVSPTRQGYSDYALYFDVCAEVSGHLGHLSSLSPDILARIGAANCTQYNTVDETVRSCEYSVSVSLAEGTVLGVAGTPPHSPGLDMGMTDTRLSDYLNPERYNAPRRGSLCPWDWFNEPIRTQIYSKIGTSAVRSTEAPECGAMAIDQEGTAKGRWTPASAPANGADPTASDFFVLAPHPYYQQSKVVISTRVAALNPSTLLEFAVRPSGRVNVTPAAITSDGQIYCYQPDLVGAGFSYLVSLASSSRLTVEKVAHAVSSPLCGRAPGTWTFTSAAVELIR